MKDLGDAIEAREEGRKRQPTELYEFWTEPPFSIVQNATPAGVHWYYTSGDARITMMGHEYVPAPIWRSGISYDSDDAASKTTVYLARPQEPLVRYIVQNPVDLVWVKISKIFRDLKERMVPIFIGHVDRVGIQGAVASAQCVGFEHYLRRSVLRWKWQKQCNHAIYDEYCGVDPMSFSATFQATVSNYGLDIDAPVLKSYVDGWFTRGFVEWEGIYRPVAYNEGGTITLAYTIEDLETGDTVTAFAGCDHKAETCRDKFNNIENFLGFKDIPVDNPTTWSGGQR